MRPPRNPMAELPDCICPGPNTILGNCPRHGNRAFRNLPAGPRRPSGGGEGQHKQDLGDAFGVVVEAGDLSHLEDSQLVGIIGSAIDSFVGWNEGRAVKMVDLDSVEAALEEIAVRLASATTKAGRHTSSPIEVESERDGRHEQAEVTPEAGASVGEDLGGEQSSPSAEAGITITVTQGVAEELLAYVGKRPYHEHWSAAVYNVLSAALSSATRPEAAPSSPPEDESAESVRLREDIRVTESVRADAEDTPSGTLASGGGSLPDTATQDGGGRL